MNESRLTEWLKSMGGLATALTAALAALGAVWAAITAQLAPISEFLGLPSWAAQAAALLTLLPILLVVVRSYRRFATASRLEQPDRFTLVASTPESLIGRTEDLTKLQDAVAKNRIVLLDGESGCGKSALVAAGLVPRLLASSGLLPVLVRDWGDDWARGPQATALGALFEVLTPSQRMTLAWTYEPDLAADGATLGNALDKHWGDIYAKLGRRLLLITDQFDDYQARHREKFLDQDGNWLKPDALAAANPFWALVRANLQAGSIHLLAVTRADTASGLSCLRFLDTAMTADRNLPRVEVEYLRPLLERIAPHDAVPVIVSQPEHGWYDLRDKIETDLRHQGAILMQQVRTLLLGLRQLPVLTVPAYRRAGELRGLESLVIARAIQRASDSAGGGQSNQILARRLLGALVLPGGPNQHPKAQRVDLKMLAEMDNGSGSAVPMLRSLQADDVVRPAEGLGREGAWQLDHDYLARAVLTEARQADRWGIALREGLERFRAAGNLQQCWSALLPMTVQARLGSEWLCGRMRFGNAAGYAKLSLIKPGLVLLLIATASVGAYLWNEDRLLSAQARAIYERFGGANQNAAVLAAWRTPRTVRDRVFHLVNEDESRLERATRSNWPLAHGGLETSRLLEAARVLQERMARETDNMTASDLTRAYASVAAKLTDQSDIKKQADALRERLARETDGFIVSHLAEAYASVATKLTGQPDIKQQADALRERLARETDGFIASELAAAYASVATKMTDQSAVEQAAEVLRERLAQESAGGTTSALARAYALVAARMKDQPAIKKAVEVLRQQLARETDGRTTLALVRAYASVAAEMTDQPAIEHALEVLRERLARETTYGATSDITRAYALVAAKLTDQPAVKQAVEVLRQRLARETNGFIAFDFAGAYASVAVKLKGQRDIEQQAEALRERLARETDSRIASELARAYASVAAKMTDQPAIKNAVEVLRERLARETDGGFTSVLVWAYASVAAEMTDQPAVKQAAEVLRERLARETDHSITSHLARAYALVAAKMKDQPALKQAVEVLRQRLARESYGRFASEIAQAYAFVAARMTDQPAVKQAIEVLREQLARETDGYTVQGFTKAYAMVAKRDLEAELRQHGKLAAAQRVREILTFAGHPFLLDATSLLTALEPIAAPQLRSDTGAAVGWWAKEYNGDPATLRPPMEHR